VAYLIYMWRKNPLPIVLIVAFSTRMLAAVILGNEVSGPSGAHDEISYSMLAQRVVSGHGLTYPWDWYPWISADSAQSYYSIAISLFYAAVYALFGYQPLIARIITGLLSTAVVGIIFVLTRRLFNVNVAAWAGLIAALYAYLIFYGITLVTETPFILALLTSILLGYQVRERPTPSKWFLLGAALSISLLLRMAVIFYLPLLLAWTILSMAPNQRREQLKWTAAPLLIITLALAPITYRNYVLWDSFMLLESQFGHVFWNGNHPGHEGDFHPYQTFPIPEDVIALDNDARITSELLSRGIDNVMSDPSHFVLLTITRVRELFTFWPTHDSSSLANALRVSSFGIMFPIALIGVVRTRSRWRDLLPLYVFMAVHIGVYSITWTMIRYRLPVDAILIIFAAVVLSDAVTAMASRHDKTVGLTQRA